MEPTDYLTDAVLQFRKLKSQAERALAQVTDEQFFVRLDAESNSLALIVKHVAGNLRSRWTDLLTSDGEKPDRRRDLEFEAEDADARAGLMQNWEHGWQCLFDALAPLTLEDLPRTVLIRREPHTVMQAINRQLTHYAGHVGQIIFLAKHLASDRWQPLTVKRGKSEDFNAVMQERHGG